MHNHSIFTIAFMVGGHACKFSVSNQGTLGEAKKRVRRILKQVNAEEVRSYMALVNSQEDDPTDAGLAFNQSLDDNDRVRCWLNEDIAQGIPIELLQDEKCASLLGFSNCDQNSKTDHGNIVKGNDSDDLKLSAYEIL